MLLAKLDVFWLQRGDHLCIEAAVEPQEQKQAFQRGGIFPQDLDLFSGISLHARLAGHDRLLRRSLRNPNVCKLQICGPLPCEPRSHVQPPDKVPELLDVVSGRSRCDPLHTFPAGPHREDVLQRVDLRRIQVGKLAVRKRLFEKLYLAYLSGPGWIDCAIEVAVFVLKGSRVPRQSLVESLAATALSDHAAALVDQPCSFFVDLCLGFLVSLRAVQFNVNEGHVAPKLIQPMPDRWTFQSKLTELLRYRNSHNGIAVADRFGDRERDFIPDWPPITNGFDLPDAD